MMQHDAYICLLWLQAMRFGDLPGWVNDLGHSIREAVLSGDNRSEHSFISSDGHEEECLFPILPLELLGREPLFDQLIVNLYHPGQVRHVSQLSFVTIAFERAEIQSQHTCTLQGICAHVDLLRFDDGIAIVSLESPCVMHFTPASSNTKEEEEENYGHPVGPKVAVYLNPGSLVIMSGEARYSWKHEINRKPGFQVWDGQELEQKRRISVTLRKLAQAK